MDSTEKHDKDNMDFTHTPAEDVLLFAWAYKLISHL